MESLWIISEPLLGKILRPLIIYGFLVVALRLAGKRQLAQMNPFDLVVLLTLSNAVQNAIIGSDNSITGGLISATVLLATNYLVIGYLFRHPKLEERLEGDPTMLIHSGRLLHKNLIHERITEADLLAAIHRQGFQNFDQVEAAILEPSGVISVFGRIPTPEQQLQQDLGARLDRLEAGLNRLAGTTGSTS